MHFTALVGVVAALAASVVSAAGPLVPSDDPFYDQPANISSYNAGAIIRSRVLPPEIQGLVPFVNITVGDVYQYMYRTADSNDNPVGAVHTYLIPQKPDNTKLLSYSVEYDTANNDCVPSYSIQARANHSVGYSIIFIQAALDKGWHVVTSDYEGLQAEFTAGVQSGHAALDSLRASLNETVRATTKLEADAKYALFGYSGGAIAAEWATEMQPQYASDLSNLVGTAIGGVTPNITNVLLTINEGIAVSLAFGASLGLTRAYSNLSDYFSEQLIQSKAAEYYSIADACSAPLDSLFQNFFSYFEAGSGILQNPVLQSVFKWAGQMGLHGIPKVPMFVYKAIGDEISPVGDTDKLMNKYCDEGVTFEYQRNTFGEHLTEALLGTPAAISWLSDRLNGVALNQSERCLIQNVTVFNVSDSGADAALGLTLAALLQVTLGDPNQITNNTNVTSLF